MAMVTVKDKEKKWPFYSAFGPDALTNWSWVELTDPQEFKADFNHIMHCFVGCKIVPLPKAIAIKLKITEYQAQVNLRNPLLQMQIPFKTEIMWSIPVFPPQTHQSHGLWLIYDAERQLKSEYLQGLVPGEFNQKLLVMLIACIPNGKRVNKDFNIHTKH